MCDCTDHKDEIPVYDAQAIESRWMKASRLLYLLSSCELTMWRGVLTFARCKFRTSRRALNVLFVRAGLSAAASKGKNAPPQPR